MRRTAPLAVIAVALLPASAWAAETATGTAETAAQAPPAPDLAHTPPHHDENQDIIVTGNRRSIDDALGGVSVLDGAALASATRPSLGETLAKEPGISASSFGPAASRPIVRGLGGDRIRILTDGIGSLDLSSTSADHAVVINPLTADRIEILRGPSALLFGSSAIGGVINVIDSRIPRRIPESPLHAAGTLGYGTAANERSAALALDVPLGGGFVIHGDGNWSKSDELETGGYILSKALREEAAASPEPEIQALADLKGKLPNSAGRSTEFAGGLSWIEGGFNAGLSVSRHTALYQVPIRYSLDPDVEAEAPTLDIKQTRYDGRVEVPLGGLFEAVKLRGGYAKYHHDEIEDTGEIATSFYTKGGEVRADLVQREANGWSGTSGVQYVDKQVRIVGEEKYLPDARQKQAGIFTLQSIERGKLRVEGGLRVETSRSTADADAQLGTPAFRTRHTTVSGSLGALYTIADGWKAGLNLSRSARAPAIDELFANGPHAGTQAFEIGDPTLDSERSVGVEASLRRTAGRVRLSLTGFTSRFANFIYQAPTGEVEDGLPVYQYSQGKARYTGFEAEVNAKLGNALGIDWSTELQADAVRATVKGYGPAPLIPPVRLLGAIAGERGPVDGRLEIERAFRQNRNAPVETETPGYTLVNASLEWHPLDTRPDLTLGLAANNIFDVEARRASSLLKDYAPLSGRDIRLTARFDF